MWFFRGLYWEERSFWILLLFSKDYPACSHSTFCAQGVRVSRVLQNPLSAHLAPLGMEWGQTTAVPGADSLGKEISSLETQCQQQLPHTEFSCQSKGCLKAPQDIKIVIDFSLFGAQSVRKSA